MFVYYFIIASKPPSTWRFVSTQKKICQIIILGFDTSFVKEAVVSL